MKVRGYCSKDSEETLKLFYDTVHSVNAVDYNQAQLDAWAPKNRDLIKWDNRLSSNYSVVVEKDGVIIGFGSADNAGYFDLLYIHKDYQGIGVATLIANDIERYIFRTGFQTITTAASITAKSFFEKRGYLVQEKQNVEVRGQLFVNFKMKKTFR